MTPHCVVLKTVLHPQGPPDDVIRGAHFAARAFGWMVVLFVAIALVPRDPAWTWLAWTLRAPLLVLALLTLRRGQPVLRYHREQAAALQPGGRR